MNSDMHRFIKERERKKKKKEKKEGMRTAVSLKREK
jgi:hypothetical protein